MDTEMKQLPEVARTLGVTVDQCRYWLSLLGITISHKGRVRIIAPDVVDLLAKVADLVKNGVAPKEACLTVKSAPVDAQVFPIASPVTGLPVNEISALKGQLDGIKEALMMLADQNRNLHGEISALREENRVIREALAPPPIPAAFLEPAPAVQAWQPPAVTADPLAGAGLLKRFWVKLVHPERLRRQAEN